MRQLPVPHLAGTLGLWAGLGNGARRLTHRIVRRGFRPPISAKSFNTTGRKAPALSLSRHVYYVLPGGKAVRYGAIVGEYGQAWSGVATVGRKEEWPGWTPTEGEKRRLGPLPNYVEGGAHNPMGARALYLLQAARTRCIASTARTSQDGSDMRFHRAASG
jgi:lipoprotein-anchoring transpeptidase ErfK/SrfK